MSNAFDLWRSDNEAICAFLQIDSPLEPLQDSRAIKVRDASRRAAHQKLLAALAAFSRKLTAELASATRDSEKIAQAQARPPCIVGLTFESPLFNLRVRVAGFLRLKIDRLCLRSILKRVSEIRLRLTQCEVLTALLNGNQIPPSVTLRVSDSFLAVPEPNAALRLRMQRLRVHRERIVAGLNRLPPPPWAAGLDRFLLGLIRKGAAQMEPENLYFPPLPEEVALSRYLFRTNSKEGRAIDNFIAQSHAAKFKDFRNHVIPFCLALVPRAAEKTEPVQTAGLLIFYRAIMDRAVHICWRFFQPSPGYFKIRAALVRRTVGSILCPPDIKPRCDPQTDWLTGFAGDPPFAAAMALMAEAALATNAVDASSTLSAAMTAVHRAAIANRVGHEPSADDMKRLIGFDDMFALLVATVIASDVPDLEQLAVLVKLFMPRICFSQLFDYAGANLEAFLGWYRDRLFEGGDP
jgi:hypothetical protein